MAVTRGVLTCGFPMERQRRRLHRAVLRFDAQPRLQALTNARTFALAEALALWPFQEIWMSDTRRKTSGIHVVPRSKVTSHDRGEARSNVANVSKFRVVPPIA